jgi:mutator protein MutT
VPAEPTPVITVVAAVIERCGRLLLSQRLRGSHLEGLWEFPGGKCEPGETHEACLAREVREELGVAASIGGEILATEHAYPDRIVRLHFRWCTVSDEPRSMIGQQLQWAAPGDLAALQFPPADAELIAMLAAGARPTASSSEPGERR